MRVQCHQTFSLQRLLYVCVVGAETITCVDIVFFSRQKHDGKYVYIFEEEKTDFLYNEDNERQEEREKKSNKKIDTVAIGMKPRRKKRESTKK